MWVHQRLLLRILLLVIVVFGVWLSLSIIKRNTATADTTVTNGLAAWDQV
jgi:hypothetical protein